MFQLAAALTRSRSSVNRVSGILGLGPAIFPSSGRDRLGPAGAHTHSLRAYASFRSASRRGGAVRRPSHAAVPSLGRARRPRASIPRRPRERRSTSRYAARAAECSSDTAGTTHCPSFSSGSVHRRPIWGRWSSALAVSATVRSNSHGLILAVARRLPHVRGPPDRARLVRRRIRRRSSRVLSLGAVEPAPCTATAAASCFFLRRPWRARCDHRGPSSRASRLCGVMNLAGGVAVARHNQGYGGSR